MIKVVQGLVGTPLGVKTVNDAPFSLSDEKEAYFVDLGVCKYADKIAAFAKPTVETASGDDKDSLTESIVTEETTKEVEKPKEVAKKATRRKKKDDIPTFEEELPQ